MTSENGKKPPTTVTFAVDGQPYTVTNASQTAESILRLVGLDPVQYDLGEVKHNGDTKIFTSTQTVRVKEGDDFVSVRKNAPVA